MDDMAAIMGAMHIRQTFQNTRSVKLGSIFVQTIPNDIV
jgi:hypothetical protein